MRLALLVCTTLVFLIACAANNSVNDTQDAKQSSATLAKIADKLHVSRDWAAVKDHVYCKILKLGRPLKEADAELAQVAQIEVSGDEKGRIYSFFDATLSKNLGYYLYVYPNSKIEIERLVVGYYSAELEAAGESIPIKNTSITCPL